MTKTRGQLLSTDKGQLVGKHQLYALLVDAAGDAILDVAGNEQVIEIKAGADGKIQTSASITGSLANQIIAGRTDATTVDQSITGDFNSIAIVNDGPNELIIAVNESTATATALFYIASGEPFERNIKGTSLHYKVAAGSATFRYDLV